MQIQVSKISTVYHLLRNPAPDRCGWHLRLARRTRDLPFHVVAIPADEVALRALIDVARWQAQTNRALVDCSLNFHKVQWFHGW